MRSTLLSIMDIHAPVETMLDAVVDGHGARDVDPDSTEGASGRAINCMACQGYPPHPCGTYRLAARALGGDPDGMELGRVTVVRRLTDDDTVDYVEAVDNGGNDLPLTEALGMMRLAEDTIIRERMEGDE